MQTTATTVAVLKGGTSAERTISLQSGANVAAALRSAGYEVTEYDVKDLSFIDRLRESAPDVVFPVLHGRGGEDGTIQGLLEVLGLRYVGSGVLASALAIDKVMSKYLYRQAGLPTAPYTVAVDEPGFDITAFMDETIDALGEHLVIKPATEGSSIGMSIISRAGDLAAALKQAFASDARVLVERFVAGREITVGVMGDAELRALPIIEIVAEGAFYDYDCKYQAGRSRHIIPAEIGPQLTARCGRLACETHRALGCRDISRTDFIIDGDGEPWILETNTLPGMTDLSLVPDAARNAGIAFPQFCAQLVEQAYTR